MNKSRGFTLVEGLLILVIVGLLGGVGWYVWNSKNKTTDTLTNADAANSSVADYSKSQTDETASWKKFTGANGLSVKFADGWVLNHYTDSKVSIAQDVLWTTGGTGGDSRLDIKKGTTAVITESSTAINEMETSRFVVSFDKSGSSRTFSTPTYEKVTDITADGIKGVKYLYEVKNGTEFGEPQGTKRYVYYFVSDKGNVEITYAIHPKDTNHLNLVEKVIKTLKLSS